MRTYCVDCGRRITEGATRCASHAAIHRHRIGVYADAGAQYSGVPKGLRLLSESDATEAESLVRIISGALAGVSR